MTVKARQLLVSASALALLFSIAPTAVAKSPGQSAIVLPGSPAPSGTVPIGTMPSGSMSGFPTQSLSSGTSGGADSVAPNPCSYYGTYHFALVYTTMTTSGAYTCGASPAAYFGWNGIMGNITAPSGTIDGLGSLDHVLAYLDMQFDETSNGFPDDQAWVQIGWGQGETGCGNSWIDPPSPELYVEAGIPTTSQLPCQAPDGTYYHYGITTLGGGAAMPSSLQFEIQVEPDGCWLLSTSSGYSNEPCGFPAVGEDRAALELESYSGSESPVSVPVTNFGGTSSSSALMVHGADGWLYWVPFNTTSPNTVTFVWHTATYDERHNTYPCTRQSDHENYYYFLTQITNSAC